MFYIFTKKRKTNGLKQKSSSTPLSARVSKNFLSVSDTQTLAGVNFTNIFWKVFFVLQYFRRPSLFADFLSANSLIHIEKRVQYNNFPVQIGLFIYNFKIRGPKWQFLSTANNEGNLYAQFFSAWNLVVHCFGARKFAE